MLNLLILIIILAVIVLFAIWIVDVTGIPYPISMALKVLIGLLALVYFLQRSGLGLAI